MEARAPSTIRDHLERLMPPGGRSRRVLGWGVVAWTGLGVAVLIGVLGRIFERLGGVGPYLVVAAMVVLALNPPVRQLTRLGVRRRLAATIVFAAAVGLAALLLSLAVPILIDQGKSL